MREETVKKYEGVYKSKVEAYFFGLSFGFILGVLFSLAVVVLAKLL